MKEYRWWSRWFYFADATTIERCRKWRETVSRYNWWRSSQENQTNDCEKSKTFLDDEISCRAEHLTFCYQIFNTKDRTFQLVWFKMLSMHESIFYLCKWKIYDSFYDSLTIYLHECCIYIAFYDNLYDNRFTIVF